MNSHLPPRVFLSYARSDGEEFARQLRARLEKDNIPLWQDRIGMEGGRIGGYKSPKPSTRWSSWFLS